MLQVKVAVCLDLESGILGPGSIPPRATKNLNSPLVGLFSFMGWQGWTPLVLDTLINECPLKGHVN
ncbi:MAG: hypothetical protein K9J38_13815 [Polynucleobacter sp.]|nr:hypothetical protein [Polynucleobacter sp.]